MLGCAPIRVNLVVCVIPVGLLQICVCVVVHLNVGLKIASMTNSPDGQHKGSFLRVILPGGNLT